MFKIGIVFKTGKQTISEVSNTIYCILQGLSNVDPFFKHPLLRQEKFEDVKIDLSAGKNVVLKTLASTIIDFSKGDILKYEKESNPTDNYSRDFGFSILIQYKDQGREISFTGKLGSNSVNGLGQLSNNGYIISLEFGQKILRALIDSCDVQTGVLKLSDLDFLKASKPFKYSLGWITFFSNDYKLQIPDDLEGIEYEHTDKGKYLILTREDFTTNKETYEAHKQKLLNLMEEIKRRVPEYSK